MDGRSQVGHLKAIVLATMLKFSLKGSSVLRFQSKEGVKTQTVGNKLARTDKEGIVVHLEGDIFWVRDGLTGQQLVASSMLPWQQSRKKQPIKIFLLYKSIAPEIF